MKCPRCGHEMTLDTHRKYALNMCYECGYIEGRLEEGPGTGASNYARLRAMNFNEAVAFISGGCLLYTSPSPRDGLLSRMPSSA